jgi:HAD superfamily hydrolase (TIGR01549 family)
MIEAAIFDLDGTLVDIPIDYHMMLVEFKRILGVDEVRPILVTLSKVTDAQKLRQIFDSWQEYESAVTDKITPCPHGIKLYQEHQNKPKALVTMQGKKTAETILAKFNLSFDTVVTREDSLSRTKQLQFAAKQLKVPLRRVLFVGDKAGDEAAAHKLHCQFIKVQ